MFLDNFHIGEYVEYGYINASERGKKSYAGKGVISQITEHQVFIIPDNALYKGYTVAISFADLKIKNAGLKHSF